MRMKEKKKKQQAKKDSIQEFELGGTSDVGKVYTIPTQNAFETLINLQSKATMEIATASTVKDDALQTFMPNSTIVSLPTNESKVLKYLTKEGVGEVEGVVEGVNTLVDEES